MGGVADLEGVGGGREIAGGHEGADARGVAHASGAVFPVGELAGHEEVGGVRGGGRGPLGAGEAGRVGARLTRRIRALVDLYQR